MAKVKISPEDLKALSSFETSIARWSMEHASLMLSSKRALDTIEALYSGRQQSIDKLLEAAGITPGQVMSVKIDPVSSEISVELRATEPTPDAVA